MDQQGFSADLYNIATDPLLQYAIKDVFSEENMTEQGSTLFKQDESVFVLENSHKEHFKHANRNYEGTRIISTEIRRNDPCPCGSGKKAKNCCGAGKVYGGHLQERKYEKD